MKSLQETVDVLIAGGGTAGHVAAIQAARAGAKTSVIEAGSMLGGTMTAGGVYMPNHFFNTEGPVVQGIAWELYTKSKGIGGLPVPDFNKRRPLDTPGYYSYINVPIYAALAEEEALEAGVFIHYHEFVAEVKAVGNTWEVVSLGRGIRRVTRAREIIDCTGDADVVRMMGLGVQKSKKRQPGAYEYKIEGIESEQVWQKEVQQIFDEAVASGVLKEGDFAYARTRPFSYYLAHGGHNATHVYDADTSDADGQTRANLDGRARMLRMFQFLRTSVPGCERAVLKTMYSHALSRESYRVEGEYTISRTDFMGAAAALAVHKRIPSREIDARDIVALTIEHGAVPL